MGLVTKPPQTSLSPVRSCRTIYGDDLTATSHYERKLLICLTTTISLSFEQPTKTATDTAPNHTVSPFTLCCFTHLVFLFFLSQLHYGCVCQLLNKREMMMMAMAMAMAMTMTMMKQMRPELGCQLILQFQILTASTDQISKQCLQTASASGGPRDYTPKWKFLAPPLLRSTLNE